MIVGAGNPYTPRQRDTIVPEDITDSGKAI